MLIYQLPNPYVQQHAGVEELSGTFLLNNLWGIKLNFLSKMTPKNLYWPTTGISTPSTLGLDHCEDPKVDKKCMHWVLVLEN